MPTAQKPRKSDVRQLVGILEEFTPEDVRRAAAEVGLAGNGGAAADRGSISFTLPAAAEALAFLPALFLATQESVTWTITKDLGGAWEVQVKGASPSRAGDTFSVGQPGRKAVVTGFLDATDGSFAAKLQVPKGAALRLRIGTDTVSTFQTP